LYKASLIAAFRSLGPAAFTAPIVEAKRRNYEVEPNDADCIFDFEFPDYMEHYHGERNHQGLHNRLIYAPLIVSANDGAIRRRARLGGMLNFYY
jgi:hypothetical protein